MRTSWKMRTRTGVCAAKCRSGRALRAGLRHADLGKFHLGAQLDLGEHRIERRISAWFRQRRGDGLEPCERTRVERSGEEANFECIERIERALPALDRLAATLARLLDALQGKQCIDSADAAHSGRRG